MNLLPNYLPTYIPSYLLSLALLNWLVNGRGIASVEVAKLQPATCKLQVAKLQAILQVPSETLNWVMARRTDARTDIDH